MLRAPAPVLDAIGTLARLGLAAVWLVSGWLKLADPGQTYLAVRDYEVLPPGVVGVVATVVPLLELVLGLALLAGLRTRLVAACSAALLMVFIAGVAQAWARGLSIDCGCFGGGGQVPPDQTRYPQDIAVDLAFLLLAGWLLVRPHTRWSADGWLHGKARPGVEHDHLVND
ncbi:MAG: MauE/DoxX family redox-associated membrane protein [Haloechinothrix sp.]